MARLSADKVNADGDLPPLGPFSLVEGDVVAWRDFAIVGLIAVGLALSGLVALAAILSRVAA
ncbi:hypothetical protein [Methylopila sp. M107]|uniref:hypothetical protein n=1 Tax=Methylopila sp. M107 TaxID=1101190 RepID=UPI000366D0F9|nr:hypothetical protein [Methylopila sp. M107]